MHWNMTIRELLAEMAEMDGGLAKLVGRNDAGEPKWAIIAIRGKEEATEILDAIEKIEAEWPTP